MERILWLALAGAAGTLSRYGLTKIVLTWTGGPFPWGTWAVNILGSFAFGVFWPLAEGRMVLSPETRLFVLTGFMGAFTTFSTFVFETVNLAGEGKMALAAANLVGQSALGILALLGGLALGRGI